jgi:hypothetical protein
MAIQQRVDVLLSLAELRGASAAAMKRLKDLKKEIDGLRVERNGVVHAAWSKDRSDPDLRRGYSEAFSVRARGSLKITVKRMNAARIELLATRIEKCQTRLQNVIESTERQLPSWPPPPLTTYRSPTPS